MPCHLYGFLNSGRSLVAPHDPVIQPLNPSSILSDGFVAQIDALRGLLELVGRNAPVGRGIRSGILYAELSAVGTVGAGEPDFFGGEGCDEGEGGHGGKEESGKGLHGGT